MYFVCLLISFSADASLLCFWIFGLFHIQFCLHLGIKKGVELHFLASQVPPSTLPANKYSPRRRRRRITYYFAGNLKLAVLKSKNNKANALIICNAIVATIVEFNLIIAVTLVHTSSKLICKSTYYFYINIFYENKVIII